jgi:hypothetical protein
MYAVTRYLVIGFGGIRSSGAPSAVWFRTREQAITEVKRRLGLVRLHQTARRTTAGYALDARAYLYEGHHWRCGSSEEYSTVPASHPEFRRAGGFRLCVMERPAEPFNFWTLPGRAAAESPTSQMAEESGSSGCPITDRSRS